MLLPKRSSFLPISSPSSFSFCLISRVLYRPSSIRGFYYMICGRTAAPQRHARTRDTGREGQDDKGGRERDYWGREGGDGDIQFVRAPGSEGDRAGSPEISPQKPIWFFRTSLLGSIINESSSQPPCACGKLLSPVTRRPSTGGYVNETSEARYVSLARSVPPDSRVYSAPPHTMLSPSFLTLPPSRSREGATIEKE